MEHRNRRDQIQERVSDTLKGILFALLAIIALIIILITFTNNDTPVVAPPPENSGSVNLPHHEEEEHPDNEDVNINEPGYVHISHEETDHLFYNGRLELPVTGATGWAAANLTLRTEPRSSSERVTNLVPGDAFTIFDETDSWWYVILPNEVSGWAEINRCFINLPDVIPSIIYNISNAVSSEFRSSGYDMPGITQNSLYSAYSFNERLDRGEFIVPGAYNLARALSAVQQLALNNGDTIIVYEVFRPLETQRKVATTLNAMVNRNDPYYNEVVSRAISESQWSVGSFISQGRSNHQLGAALDVTIGIVEEIEIVKTGDYSHRRIKYYSRVNEPSLMHELSPRAVLPGRNSAAASNIDERIWIMKSYFETMGFSSIASEWWHFNHSSSISTGSASAIGGNFFTPTIYSIPPFN